MSEVLLPTWIIPEQETHEWLDEGSSVFQSAFAPGLAQRQSYGGLRLKLSRRHTVRLDEKAQLLSIIKSTRGRFNVLRTKVHFERRGSGFGSELMTDTDFSAWTSNAPLTIATVIAQDRVLRIHRIGNTGGAPSALSTAVTGVLYAPYVGRVLVKAGRGPILWDGRIRDNSDTSVNYAATASNLTADGYQAFAGVPYDTDLLIGVVDRPTGKMAGDYMDIWYASIARGMQVDNGLNSGLQSDEFDTTWVVTRSSIDDQTAGTTAPDGTSTADALHEDATAASTHYVEQAGIAASAAAGDYSFACALKAANRTWGSLSLLEATGSTELGADFDLANGLPGTTRAGANWSNVRSFIQSLGDGWYYCCVVGRKTNAATSLTERIWVGEADNDRTFNGLNQDSIYLWRGTPVPSGVPTRLIQTTTTASTGTSQTGNALHVKGLPASTNGLLLPGDWIEIGGELKQVSAALNSDAAGLGYLQFEPALVRSPANDDPVIVTDPMGKFLVSNIRIDNEFGTQAVVTYDLEHIYE